MSAPEDDPVPAYSEAGDDDMGAWVYSVAGRAEELGLPLTRFPDGSKKDDPAFAAKKRIITTFFRLVRSRQTDAVALFVYQGLVSPDVMDDSGGAGSVAGVPPCDGATPLLAAVDAGDAAMVRLLAGLGGDVDGLARPPGLRRLTRYNSRSGDDKYERLVRRTPLMLAAEQGRVALVILLLTVLGADDAVVAPDGQTALRLAADAGHRDIVVLLPARRGGGWRRFRTRHGRNMQRVGRRLRNVWFFVDLVVVGAVYRVPKTLVCNVWKPLRALAGWVGRELRHVWQHPRETWTTVRTWTAARLADLARLPRALTHLARETAQALGRAITRIPAACRLAGHWVADTAATVARALADVVLRAASAVHTALVAIVGFFRTVTLRDVWHGLGAAARAVVVGLPRAVAHGLDELGDATYLVLQVLLGGLGVLLYVLGYLLYHAAAYLPRQLWKIVMALGNSVSSAWHEILVAIDPKL